MDAKKKIRFGVLGTSRIAKKSVLPTLVASRVADLAAIGSRLPEKAAALAEEFGCAGHGSYEHVLRDPAIDAVYLSLPNALHEEWAIKAAAAGKHVWCEKPAALDYASAKRMVAAAEKSGVCLMEGFMFLCHPQHAKANALIAEGALGEILTFSGCFSYLWPPAGDIRLQKELGGGSYFDSAVYPIRASRMIFGAEPETVSCSLSIDPASGVDWKADMLLAYAGGRSAHISSAFGGYYRSTYEVLGSSGHLALERAYAVPKNRAVKVWLERNDAREEFGIAAADQFSLMLEDFCAEIRRGEQREKQYEEDLLAQARIVAAGLRARKEMRTVRLAEMDD